MAERLRRRRTDVVEDIVAWVLLSAGLLGAVVAALVGWSVDAQALDRGRADAAVRTRISAVLLEDSPTLAGDAGGSRGPVYALARWEAQDGSTRSGHVSTTPDTPAGTDVPIWIDRSGAAVPAPTGPIDAAFLGAACGIGVLAAVGCALAVMWVGARRAIDTRNAARWEREWERVGPQWSRHLR